MIPKSASFICLAVLLVLTCYARAQDGLQAHLEDGKYLGIFPVVGNDVVYTDSVMSNGSAGKDMLMDKAKAFFDKKEDAKYYFESEDHEAGEIIYQGELNKSIMSRKSDVHFTMSMRISDSVCRFRLYEIVMAYAEGDYSPAIDRYNGKIGTASKRTSDSAVQLEQITIDKGEFSRSYCEKLNKRFMMIMQGLEEGLH
jgi:hypothetical protein